MVVSPGVPLLTRRRPPATAGESRSAACHRADDHEGFVAGHDAIRKRAVGIIMRDIGLTGEEADERPALRRPSITDRAEQLRKLRLQRVEHGALSDLVGHGEADLAVYLGQLAQVVRKDDPNGVAHGTLTTVSAPRR